MNRPDLHIVEPPHDYVERVRFIPSPAKLTFGEKLVLWFRLNGETTGFVFAMAAIALAVAVFVAAYGGVL